MCGENGGVSDRAHGFEAERGHQRGKQIGSDLGCASPITITSGSKAVATPERTRPSSSPASVITARAIGSPECIRDTTFCSGCTGTPAREAYSAAIAGPDATASR